MENGAKDPMGFLKKWMEQRCLDKFKQTKYYRKINEAAKGKAKYRMIYVNGKDGKPRFAFQVRLSKDQQYEMGITLSETFAVKLENPNEYNCILISLGYDGKKGD